MPSTNPEPNCKPYTRKQYGTAVRFKASLPVDNSDPIHHLCAVWSWTSLNDIFVLLFPHLSNRDNNTAWLLGVCILKPKYTENEKFLPKFEAKSDQNLFIMLFIYPN